MPSLFPTLIFQGSTQYQFLTFNARAPCRDVRTELLVPRGQGQPSALAGSLGEQQWGQHPRGSHAGWTRRGLELDRDGTDPTDTPADLVALGGLFPSEPGVLVPSSWVSGRPSCAVWFTVAI